MKLGVERVTRLILQSFDDPSELDVGVDDAEGGLAHEGGLDRGRAANDRPATIDPSLGATGDIDGIEPLRPQEFNSTSTAAPERTDHIDRDIGRNFADLVGDG